MTEWIGKAELYILKMEAGEEIPIQLKVSEDKRDLFIEIGKLMMYSKATEGREYSFSSDYKFFRRVR